MKRLLAIVIDLLLGAAVGALLASVIVPALLDAGETSDVTTGLYASALGAAVFALAGIFAKASIGGVSLGIDAPEGRSTSRPHCPTWSRCRIPSRIRG